MRKTLTYILIAGHAMLLVLALFHEKIELPWLVQASGRTHPMLLHLPIGLLVLALIVFIFRRRFEERIAEAMLGINLHLAAICALLSALAGIALSTEPGYATSEVLARHLNLGVALSVCTALLAGLHHRLGQENNWFKGTAAVVTVLLFMTGHTGSTLTHGEDFLTEPFKQETTPQLSDSATFFQAGIYPILERKCVSCHNTDKRKGGLVMTSAVDLLKGGEHGAVWIPGDTDSSAMLVSIRLPLEHDDHMPPKGKPQLTREEAELLTLFIRRGADMKLAFKEVAVDDSLFLLAESVNRSARPATRVAGHDFDPTPADLLQKLNVPGRSVSPLSLDDHALRASFFLPGGFRNELIRSLEPVAESLVELNLSGMPIDEESIKLIGSFKSLEKLWLNQTPVQDAWLPHLEDLSDLKMISLSATAISADGLRRAAAIPGIREVFFWATPAAKEDIGKLRNEFSDIVWMEGVPGRTDETLRLTPPILVNENRILANGEYIRLKHNLPGVEIRITTDGRTVPDSVTGQLYEKPIAPSGAILIKARAVKEGWLSSRLAEFTFFTAGMKPDSIVLLSSPDKDYRASGAKSLTDAKGGDADNFRDGFWLGFREGPLIATADFGEPTALGTISVSYLKNIGSYIMPPARVRIEAGPSMKELTTVGITDPTQPDTYLANAVEAIPVEVQGKHRYWRITVSPVAKLPSWHGGKGQKGWVMVDELFFHPPKVQ